MDSTVSEEQPTQRKARDVPIVIAGPTTVAVRRRGVEVFVQPKGEQGVTLTHRNAAQARVTEDALRRRLREGFDGDVVALIRAAAAETEAAHDAFKAEHAARAARAARIDELKAERQSIRDELECAALTATARIMKITDELRSLDSY